MNYKSSIRLLGLPLVHVAIGPPEGSPGVRGIAKGWIAVGDIAFGIAFALGGLAVGGLSVGGLSVGVLAVGGLSIGSWWPFDRHLGSWWPSAWCNCFRRCCDKGV